MIFQKIFEHTKQAYLRTPIDTFRYSDTNSRTRVFANVYNNFVGTLVVCNVGRIYLNCKTKCQLPVGKTVFQNLSHHPSDSIFTQSLDF